jgi:hypothetical protein
VGEYDLLLTEALSACAAALSLLENIGTGKWAKTPAGDKLRAVIEKAEEAGLQERTNG